MTIVKVYIFICNLEGIYHFQWENPSGEKMTHNQILKESEIWHFPPLSKKPSASLVV